MGGWRIRHRRRDASERVDRASEASWSLSNAGNRAARSELQARVLVASAPGTKAEGGRLLDCGCGHGWLLEALLDEGVPVSRLVGVDVDPERLRAASRRAPGVTVLQADARALPFADEEFSMVFCMVSLSSMETTTDVRGALNEVGRVLRPGGALIVYEPAPWFPLLTRTARVTRGSVRRGGFEIIDVHGLTLAPPLARRLGPLTAAAYPALARVPLLRSHRLTIARRERR